ncbi:MAG: PIG-L family deacetylase [Chloroflexota bacterium]
MNAKRLLIALAHPDDESFFAAPLIATSVAQGVEVTLICATNGDVGSTDEKHLKGYSSVAEMRLAELDCAVNVLGFKEVVKWGYRDSGMIGTPDNDNPASFFQAPLDKVTECVIDVIHRTCPQVIYTFDPYGVYGHPDHIKIHKATVAAFQAVQSDPQPPQKLYYGGNPYPKRLMRTFLIGMRVMGKDPRKQGRNADMDMQAMYDAILPIHTRIDASAHVETAWRSMACHASQGGSEPKNAVARLMARQITSTANLTKVYPAPKPGDPIERDIFAGVNLA